VTYSTFSRVGANFQHPSVTVTMRNLGSLPVRLVSLGLLLVASPVGVRGQASPVPAAQPAAPARPVLYDIRFPNAVHREAEVTVTFHAVPTGPLRVRMARSSPGTLRAPRVRQERLCGEGGDAHRAPAGGHAGLPARVGRDRASGSRGVRLHALCRPRRRYLRRDRRDACAPQHPGDVRLRARRSRRVPSRSRSIARIPPGRIATQLEPTDDSRALQGPATCSTSWTRPRTWDGSTCASGP
jgi:hypothetical protein